jgi:hypothetical protein
MASVGALGCGGKKSTSQTEVKDSVLPVRTAAARSAPPEGVTLDMTRDLGRCSLGHDGILLDFGDPSMSDAFGLTRDKVREVVEHEGATWLRAREKRLQITYLSPIAVSAEGPGLSVVAHARGGTARTLTVSVNGKGSATLTLDKTRAAVTSAKLASAAIDQGPNDITLTFGGMGKTPGDYLADIDWIHIGPTGDEAAYSAPTRADALTQTTLNGEAKPALSLRGPGFATCTTFVPKAATFSASLGVTKGGDADLELRLRRDRSASETLATWHLGPDDAGAWKPVNVPLASGGALSEVSLVVTRTSKGARALVGEPKIRRDTPVPTEPAPRPKVNGVVLVVMGELSPRAVPGYGGRLALPALDSLARRGFVFDDHRSATTLASGALASMLTGTSPRMHGVLDQSARLPASVTTVADAARQAGVDTAFFTANPLTGRAFGFDRGFATFEAHAPQEDVTPSKVFEDAARFIEARKDGRFLVVIHARGAHPPWDATADDLKDMAPTGYGGGLEPRHAAELMSKARRVPPVLRFQDADRERAWALADLALSRQDKALSQLMESLHASGRDATTLLLVTADLAADETAHVPFGDPETLEEQLLHVPLYLAPPGTTSGKHVGAPTTSMDVAVTALSALGLGAPKSFHGRDLWALGNGEDGDDGRGRLALSGPRFSGRIGPFVLSGIDSREGRLCSLELEPACTTDVRATHPIAAHALHRFLFESLNDPEKAAQREPATIDADTLAALRIWGL